MEYNDGFLIRTTAILNAILTPIVFDVQNVNNN